MVKIQHQVTASVKHSLSAITRNLDSLMTGSQILCRRLVSEYQTSRDPPTTGPHSWEWRWWTRMRKRNQCWWALQTHKWVTSHTFSLILCVLHFVLTEKMCFIVHVLLYFGVCAVQTGALWNHWSNRSRNSFWENSVFMPTGASNLFFFSWTYLSKLFVNIGETLSSIIVITNSIWIILIPQLPDLEAVMKKENQKILTPLVSLDTPGKATVEVVILADPVSALPKWCCDCVKWIVYLTA